MTSREYWEKRKAWEMYNAMQTAEDAAEELKKVYFLASDEITEEIKRIARRFQLKHKLTEKDARRLLSKVKNPEDITMLIQALKANPQMADLAAELESQAYAARIRRLQATQEAMDAAALGIFGKVRKKMTDVLSKIGQASYFHEIFGLQQRAGAAFAISPLDQKRLETVLKRRWSGQNFSARLWKDTDRLAAAVKEQILLELLTGKREHDISQEIAARFSVGYNDARRLIRTEASYVTNQMQLEAYKEMGVTKYIYVATLDLRTSKICRSLDKKTFEVKDATVGVNYPPMHPWCRSTTMEWVSAELLAKMEQNAWDPVNQRTVTVPADMTYEQWYDKYVKNGTKAPQNEPQAPTERNLTRAQYDRYKERLGDAFPFTYDEFIKMKSDKGEWARWQQAYKDARPSESGNVPKQMYKDIEADEWYPDVTPGSHTPEYLTEIELDGEIYPVDGHNIKYLNDRNAMHEKEIGDMLAKDIGGPVVMRPKVDYPKGHSLADIEFNGKLYDIKTLEEGAGPNTIYNRVKKKKKQSNSFIVDVTKPGLSDDVVAAQIDKIFWSRETRFVDEIVIIRNGKILRIAKRA